MFRERTYRSNFVKVSLATSAVTMPFTPDGLRDLVRVPGYLPGVLAIFAALWLFFYFLCRWFPIQAGPDGVRGYNGIGSYYEVPWSAMRSASTLWPYVVVRRGKWGSALCIPLFLADHEGFRGYVLQHAPEGNPLRKYLERR